MIQCRLWDPHPIALKVPECTAYKWSGGPHVPLGHVSAKEKILSSQSSTDSEVEF